MRNKFRFRHARLRIIGTAALSLILLFGLAMGQRESAPIPELSVDVLLSGTRGDLGHAEPSATWITSNDELDGLIKSHHARQLSDEDRQAILGVDFNASRALLVRMGQQPTAGYSLSLTPEDCGISGRIARISLVWKEPAQGMATAQMITHPFILLKISRDGYNSLQVIDQHGKARIELSVSD